MGVVYKVIFPDGSFYIGATINLKNRMMQHRYHATNKLLKAKIKEFKMSKDAFIELFSILHEGDDFREVEGDIIRRVKGQKLCLNMAGVRWCHPDKICRRIIKCTVKHNIYLLFKEIEESLNSNTEGAIEYLVKLHQDAQLRSDDASSR